MLIPLLAAGIFALHPPEGTYVYEVAGAGTTTITISAQDRGLTVAERMAVPGLEELSGTTYDAATLAQTSYSADAIVSGSVQHATAAFSQDAVTLHAGSQTIAMSRRPGTARAYYFDSMMSLFAMMPSIETASRAPKLTLADNHGHVSVISLSAGGAQPRPAAVPVSDAALKIDFGQLAVTVWYNRASLVMDGYTQPSVVIALKSYDPQVAHLAPLAEQTPLPLPAAQYESRNVFFRSADGTMLAGTITMPRLHASRAGVVLVHGSGPENRDEAIGPNHIFEQIANALSNAGYTVLRYDKRGIGQSGGNALTAIRAQLVADAQAAVQFLRAQRAVDPKRIFVLGHSEGAEIAPSMAIADRTLHGLILMGAPALPLDQILMQQGTRGLSGTALVQARANEQRFIDQIKAGKNPIPGSAWFRSSFGFDPAQNIARVNVPMLILQGGKDIQVLPKDLPRLVNAARAAHRNLTVRVFPLDDHLMLTIPGSAPSTGFEYFVPSYVDPNVIAAILSFLKAH